MSKQSRTIRGASLVEYALLLTLIAMICIVSLRKMGYTEACTIKYGQGMSIDMAHLMGGKDIVNVTFEGIFNGVPYCSYEFRVSQSVIEEGFGPLN